MAERKKVVATVVVGPEKLLGSGYKWAKVDIVKPRSAVSEKVRSFDIAPSPDNRWILTYEYVSGRSLGVTNKGTVSSRVYKRHRTEVVDEVTLKSEDGTVIGSYDENGKHAVRGRTRCGAWLYAGTTTRSSVRSSRRGNGGAKPSRSSMRARTSTALNATAAWAHGTTTSRMRRTTDGHLLRRGRAQGEEILYAPLG